MQIHCMFNRDATFPALTGVPAFSFSKENFRLFPSQSKFSGPLLSKSPNLSLLYIWPPSSLRAVQVSTTLALIVVSDLCV